LNNDDKSEFLLDCLILPANYSDLHSFVFDLNTILKIYPDKNEGVYKIINDLFGEFNMKKTNLEDILIFSIRAMAIYEYNEEHEEDEKDEHKEENEKDEDEEYREIINKNIKETQRAMDVISDIVVTRYVAETNYKKQTQEIMLKKKQAEMKYYTKKFFEENPMKTGLTLNNNADIFGFHTNASNEYLQNFGPGIKAGGKRKTRRNKPKKTCKKFQKKSRKN
jgi:hypothetical protein